MSCVCVCAWRKRRRERSILRVPPVVSERIQSRSLLLCRRRVGASWVLVHYIERETAGSTRTNGDGELFTISARKETTYDIVRAVTFLIANAL